MFFKDKQDNPHPADLWLNHYVFAAVGLQVEFV